MVLNLWFIRIVQPACPEHRHRVISISQSQTFQELESGSWWGPILHEPLTDSLSLDHSRVLNSVLFSMSSPSPSPNPSVPTKSWKYPEKYTRTETVITWPTNPSTYQRQSPINIPGSLWNNRRKLTFYVSQGLTLSTAGLLVLVKACCQRAHTTQHWPGPDLWALKTC